MTASAGCNPLTGLFLLRLSTQRPARLRWQGGVAIPLRGFFFCNLVSDGYAGVQRDDCCNPLAGLFLLRRDAEGPQPRPLGRRVAIPLRGFFFCDARSVRTGWCTGREVLQSPCGAFSFATTRLSLAVLLLWRSSCNPLTGLFLLRRGLLLASMGIPLVCCCNPLTGLFLLRPCCWCGQWAHLPG